MSPSELEKLSKQRMRGQRILECTAHDPIDRLAGRVTGKGVSFEPELKIGKRIFSHEPLALRMDERDYANQDLRGRTVGSFTVLGLCEDRNMRWVVQCKCGTYEVRTSKSIKNPKNRADACVRCLKGSYYLRKGRRLCLRLTQARRNQS